MKFDSKRLDGLPSKKAQTTRAPLEQFLCALQWVKQGILKFAELKAPLQDFMERVYARTSKRTKQSISRVSLATLGWVHPDKQLSRHARRLLHAKSPSHIEVSTSDCPSTPTLRSYFGLLSWHKSRTRTQHSLKMNNGTSRWLSFHLDSTGHNPGSPLKKKKLTLFSGHLVVWTG